MSTGLILLLACSDGGSTSPEAHTPVADTGACAPTCVTCTRRGDEDYAWCNPHTDRAWLCEARQGTCDALTITAWFATGLPCSCIAPSGGLVDSPECIPQ